MKDMNKNDYTLTGLEFIGLVAIGLSLGVAIVVLLKAAESLAGYGIV